MAMLVTAHTYNEFVLP